MDDDRKKFERKGAAGKAARPPGKAARQDRAGNERDPERPGAGKGKAVFRPRRNEPRMATASASPSDWRVPVSHRGGTPRH